MTLFAYTLEVETGDFIALYNAIKPYSERCRAEIAAGNTWPFQHDLNRLEALMKRLNESEELLSRHIPAKAGQPARIELGNKLFKPKAKRKKKPRGR